MTAIISTKLEDKQQYASYLHDSLELSASYLTSKGGREENQDCFGYALAADGTQVLSVADGLGGHVGGRVASQVAIARVNEFVQSEKFNFFAPLNLVEMFQAVNNALVAQQQTDAKLSKMRTTLVVLLIKDNLAFWGHIGDVRLYLFREGLINFQTRDHSVPQMLVDMEEITAKEMRNHPDRSRLLNALGSSSKDETGQVTADKVKVSMPLHYTQLQQADFFHLSTDGFWEWIEEEIMLKVIDNPLKHKSLEQITNEMEQIVLQNAQIKEPKHDNYTALNIKINQASLNLAYWHKAQFKPESKYKNAK